MAGTWRERSAPTSGSTPTSSRPAQAGSGRWRRRTGARAPSDLGSTRRRTPTPRPACWPFSAGADAGGAPPALPRATLPAAAATSLRRPLLLVLGLLGLWGRGRAAGVVGALAPVGESGERAAGRGEAAHGLGGAPCPERLDGGLFDQQLRQRVGLQALVGDRPAAGDRAAVGAPLEPLLGALQGGPAVAQRAADRPSGLLGDPPVGVVDVVTLVGGCCPDLGSEQPLEPGAFVGDQLLRSCVVHRRSSSSWDASYATRNRMKRSHGWCQVRRADATGQMAGRPVAWGWQA